MKIDAYFEKEYLVAGNTYDNFVFENCPSEFLAVAKHKLSTGEKVKSCCVSLTKKEEQAFEKIAACCATDLQKKVLARDFVVALVLNQLLKGSDKVEKYEFASAQVNAFFEGNFEKVKTMHGESFMPHDIKRLAKEFGKIELNLFLSEMKSVVLQQAVNLFLSSREPYSVKLFTSGEKLSTYYDLNGNLIESPHDFMRRDVNKFIEADNIEKS